MVIPEGGPDASSTPPGKHTVQLRLDWTSSPEVSVDVGEGSTVGLTCEAGGGVWTTARQALINRKNYLRLRVDG